jgi:hypothetical protein
VVLLSHVKNSPQYNMQRNCKHSGPGSNQGRLSGGVGGGSTEPSTLSDHQQCSLHSKLRYSNSLGAQTYTITQVHYQIVNSAPDRRTLPTPLHMGYC